MKNILIIGVGRAGKTTLSNKIKQKYNFYNLIHSDSIKWALIRAADKEEYYRTNIEEQKEFEHGEYFQKVLLEFFNSSIRNDIHKNGYILECGQLEPRYVKQYVDLEKTKVICLGHGNMSEKDIMELCRKYDRKEDWSYGLQEEKLQKHTEKWYQMNELLKEQCPKYGFQYIDTSRNRNEILDKIVQQIQKEE